MRLIDELNELHDRYLREIDIAVGCNGFARAQRPSSRRAEDGMRAGDRGG